MGFLGQVDQLEIGGEGSGHVFDQVGAEGFQALGEGGFDLRVGVGAPGLGQGADALLEFEKLDPGLAADDLPEQVAEQVDVGAEGFGGAFGVGHLGKLHVLGLSLLLLRVLYSTRLIANSQ